MGEVEEAAGDPYGDLDLRTALGVALGYQVLDFVTIPDDSYTTLRASDTFDWLIVGDRVALFNRSDRNPTARLSRPSDSQGAPGELSAP